MTLLGSVTNVEVDRDGDGLPFEAGTLYQIHKCTNCEKVSLVAGAWHEMMEDAEDWAPETLLPEAGDRAARQLLLESNVDRECMRAAVDEARKCPDHASDPRVGAVVAHNGRQIAKAFRGEADAGDHAEFVLLEKKCKSERLAGATVYTTLEPCTVRNEPKIPCVQRLIGRRVSRVVIGMLDPDERIRGRGVLALRKAGIRVDLFPPDLMDELEELNRGFIAHRESNPTHTGSSKEPAAAMEKHSVDSGAKASADTEAQLEARWTWKLQPGYTGDRHEYKLSVQLYNKSSKLIDEWKIDLWFPSIFIEGAKTSDQFTKWSASDADHSGTSGRIWPHATLPVFTITYVVTDKNWPGNIEDQSRQPFMRIVVSTAESAPVETRVPIEEIQEF